MYYMYSNSLGALSLIFIWRYVISIVSLIRSVLYWRFHCTFNCVASYCIYNT